MIRNTISLFLTIFTIIGGHFVNHRWDRAIFILGLLILLGGSCFGYLSISFEPITDSDAALNLSKKIWKIFTYGSLSIWILSLILNIYDIRQQSERVVGGFSGYFGATALSILTMLIGLSIAWNILDLNKLKNSSSAGTYSSYSQSSFHDYLSFGGRRRPQSEFTEAPDGTAKINGRIQYLGEPVEGMKFELVINDEFETKQLVSDSAGYFSVNLPEGDWVINSVRVSNWPGKPKGQFNVVSGHEPVLEGGSYSKYSTFRMNGLKVVASNDDTTLALDLKIKPKLEVVWPPYASRYDPSVKGTEATLKNGIIEWKPYEGATQYVVEFSSITREGNGTSSRPVIDVKVTDTTLALSRLKTVPHTGEGKEYGVEVFAFDENGTFLSMADTGGSGGAFVLTDGNALVEKSVISILGTDASIERMQEHRVNQKRIDAAKVLVDEDMLNEAAQLITKIEGESRSGQKELVEGFLAAKQGNCKKATELFEIARAKVGKTCIPQRYLKLCP